MAIIFSRIEMFCRARPVSITRTRAHTQTHIRLFALINLKISRGSLQSGTGLFHSV